MNGKFIVNVASLWLLLGCTQLCLGETKRALVIGNSSYKDAPLPNPANDASDMAGALRRLGFTVTVKLDATQREMESTIRTFGEDVQQGDVALFFYAGHGTEVDGVNYLIPIAADIETRDEIKFKAVPADLVLAKLETAGSRLNVIILDACRSNPFRRFRSGGGGLAQMESPAGTLIAYATAPGKTASDGAGRNSPFTKNLLASMSTPGLEVGKVFRTVRAAVMSETNGKQVPWESSSLLGDFYFLRAGRIHALIVGDTTDQSIGPDVAKEIKGVIAAFQANVPPSQLDLRVGDNALVTPANLFDVLRDVGFDESEPIVLFFTGHGFSDETGELCFHLGRGGNVRRSAIVSAMRAKRARVAVVISNCSAVRMRIEDGAVIVRRINSEAWTIPDTASHPPAQISPLFRSLFVDAKGTVLVNACSVGENSWSKVFGPAWLKAMGESSDKALGWNQLLNATQRETSLNFNRLRSGDQGEIPDLQQQQGQTIWATIDH